MFTALVESGLRALATVVVLIGFGRLAGLAARRFGQPAVVGELLVGIVLGPTVLGHFPALSRVLIPATGGSLDLVGWLAKTGLVLFVLGAGAEVHASGIRTRIGAIVPIALLGFVLPLVGGAIFGSMMAHADTGGIGIGPQAWFLGIALSVSALPVIARTLTDLGLLTKPFGTTVIGSVVVTDLLAWTGLAIVVLASVEGASSGGVGRLVADAVLVVFLVGLALPERAKRWLVGDDGPRSFRIVRTAGALLYFTSAGLRLDLGAALEPVFSIGVLVIAITSKTLGSYLGARLAGITPRSSAAIGVAMNARGAMEIVIATTGIQLGLADERTYATLVVLAIASSVATAPVVRALGPDPTLGSGDYADAVPGAIDPAPSA